MTDILSDPQKKSNEIVPGLNLDQARQFFDVIFSPYLKEASRPAYIEVRGKREADRGMTLRRFFLGLDSLYKDMGQWPVDHHFWFGIAPRWSDTKGTKKECIALTVIFTDVDYGSAGHKKKNRWQTREEAQAAIDAFPLPPSILVHTGGGFQAYWSLSEPFGLENGNGAQVEAIMKGIGAEIGGDDGTQDVSRIFRIPGTFNVKTSTPRPVEIISCDPARVYDLADFAHYATQAPPPPPPPPAGEKAPPQDDPRTTNIDELNVAAWVKGLIRTGDIGEYPSRSERDHAVIGALKRAGYTLDTIEAIFREHPVGGKYQEKGTQGRGYLKGSYDKDTSRIPSTLSGFTGADILNFAKAGQVGDSRLFIRLFIGKFIYDHAAGRWYRWGGHYWLDDDVETVLMALDRVVDLYQEGARWCAQKKVQAIRASDEQAAKDAAFNESIFLKKIASLQNKRWRRDVLEFSAAGDGSLGIAGKEWDHNVMLIACPNGILDLNTKKFRPGQPEDYIKVACPTEWKGRNEPAPEWEKFHLQIFNGDVEQVDYVQRLDGYTISGQRKERVLPVSLGIGWNGKGTRFEVLEHTLGGLAGPVPSEILLEDGRNYRTGGSPTPEIMRLRGMRMVWASETNEGGKLNASRVKLLTGGDTLVGRDPFGKRLVSFPPTHTLYLITNHRPKANADDFALWQRIHLIPFNLSFVDHPTEPHERQRDKHIVDRLKQEASGILAWLVRGFFEWQEQGLNPPASVQEATREYRETEDNIGQFISEQCVVQESARVKASEFYGAYKDWCEANGLKPEWGNIFAQRVSVKFSKEHTWKGAFYLGVGFESKD